MRRRKASQDDGKKCRCAEDPYRVRRMMSSSLWADDGVDASDDDVYGIICRLEQQHRRYEPLSANMAQRIAHRAIQEICHLQATSSLVMESSQTVAPFDLDEIELGAILGTGGFSSVYEINAFHLSSTKEFTREEVAARDFVSKNARRNSNGETRYALKHLRSRLLPKTKKFANGAIDLAMEAQFLASLEHPNILKIRGITADGPKGFASGRHDGFFLIVDKVNETLEDRILRWRKQLKKFKRPVFGRIVDQNGKKQKNLLAERLKVGYDIAKAMEYLHERRVIYRDLKPSNIGFDIRGDVKVFDFGLCRELPPESEKMDDKYNMSGKVGTFRYIAPEVMNRQSYNLKADVFSYAMVLYEILSLSQPWAMKDSAKKDIAEILSGEKKERNRTICPCWPLVVQDLMQQAWSEDISERPTMAEICNILREEIIRLRDGDTTGLERANMRRRSTHIMDLSQFKGFETSGALKRRWSLNTQTTSESISQIDGGFDTFALNRPLF